ncbi:MAG: endonuclease/exonuclease/phosphatase family protein [Pseudomonadales bacterium]
MLKDALDPSQITLLNWNIAKGNHKGWQQDFKALCKTVDIALLQEAKLEYDMPALFNEHCCWSFAPGFTRPDHSTGVMTMAVAETINRSVHSHREPWTRIPKAALISEFKLQDSDLTLMVANVHAINFTAGVRSFKRQLYSLLDELLHHHGPIIFAGDFNTWRRKRLSVVDDIIQILGLEVIQFAFDHRKQAFGMALDHVFVRGLTGSSAAVEAVFSSDHNPMTVTLALVPRLARQTPALLAQSVTENL